MGAYQKLQSAGIKVVARRRFDYTGEFFILLAQTIGPTLGVVLVAWLQARAKRKVTVKFRGVQIEAGTPEEVGEMLKRIAEFQDRKQNAGEDQS